MRSSPSLGSPVAAERVPSTVTVRAGSQTKGRLKKASMVVVVADSLWRLCGEDFGRSWEWE